MIVIERTVDLSKPISTETLRGNEFTGEARGHQFRISVVQDGEPVTLTGSISAKMLLANGDGLELSSLNSATALEDGVAVVTLVQACYGVPGRFHLGIYHTLTTSGVTDTTCIYSCVGSVVNATGDPEYSPGAPIGNLETLFEEAETASAEAASALAQATAVVSYAEQTTQTDAQKAQARANIGAASDADVQLTAAGHQSLNISGYDSIQCTVSGTNTYQRSAAKYQSRQFAPNRLWKKIAVTANSSNGTHVTFVTEAIPSVPTPGDNMSSLLCSGETGRHGVAAGTTELISIPSDCAFIVIAYTSSGNDVTPSSVVVYTEIGGEIEGKQDLLTFDNEPIPASANPVKSGGIYKTMEKVVSNIGSVFQNFIQKSISSTTGNLSDTGAENCITNSALIPIDAIFAAKADVKCVALYLYADDGSFIRTTASNSQSFVGMDFIASVLVDSPTAKYVRVRFGNSTYPVTLQTYGQMGVSLILMQDLASGNGHVTFDSIAGYGNGNRVFTPSDENDLDFTVTVPFNGDSRNQIYTCNAKFEQAEGVTDVPTIIFRYGNALNRTTQYTLANKGSFETKQWRVIRYPGVTTDLSILFHIPVGVTVTIKDFYNEYSDRISRNPNGIRINSHRQFLPSLMNPDTLPGVMMAVKSGACAMIQIPKRLSDGTWIFYHDDTLVYNDTYIRQADGTELPSTYNGTLWSAIDFETANSWDWGISKNAMFTGTKPMTMEQFFTICGKTGIMPMLSIHPWPSDSELGEIKAIARKCGVLNRLGIKCSVARIGTAYSIFGNDIESYTIDVSSGTQTQSVVEAAITAMNGLTGCTVRRVIELFAITAYNAYFGTTQYDAFKLIADAGYGCSLAQQTGAYHPTLPNGSSAVLKGTDIDYWQSKGVSEYTYEYDWSNGLNW